MTPIKASLRRASTNSASFLSTLNLPSQQPTLTHAQTQPLENTYHEKTSINLNLFGGRLLDQTIEQLTKELEGMFEV